MDAILSMRKWVQELSTAPEVLSALERRLVWAATFLVAVTRVTFASRSLWDWDEALFSFALRDYDVAAHHPHPPGFPLFVAAAKLVRVLVGSELRALQIVSLIGAVALFPLMFSLARELRAVFSTAFSAALLLVFFPNVWFYGGTGLSDIPSLALVLLACVLLLRGCRSGGAYIAGAFVLAVAAGFRPQNLLIGLGPALLATWWRIRNTRSPFQPLLATGVGACTLLISFGGAAMATGDWETYWTAVSEHRAYIAAVDSFRSPSRPALWRLIDDFFVRPYRMIAINAAIGTLSGIAIVGGLLAKRRSITFALIVFGPFCIVGWLMLDHLSASRFSIAWAPLVALAVADGSAIIAGLLSNRRARAFVQIAIPAVLVVVMAAWALPGLAVTHNTESPPIQAVQWIRSSLPRDARLYVHGSMAPYSDLLLADYRTETFVSDAPPVWPDDRNAWLLREGIVRAARARRFSYPRRPLWNIARQRYFEVTVVPLCPRVRFGEGWYGEERADVRSFRWMGARATVLLPPAAGESARLSLRGHVPLDAMTGTPAVTITLDGKVIDRFAATQAGVERTYLVASRSARFHELEIRLDRVGNAKKKGAGTDARDLGMRLDAIAWSGDGYDCGA
jgi:hypothetical protein